LIEFVSFSIINILLFIHLIFVSYQTYYSCNHIHLSYHSGVIVMSMLACPICLVSRQL